MYKRQMVFPAANENRAIDNGVAVKGYGDILGRELGLSHVDPHQGNLAVSLNHFERFDAA